MIIQEIENRHRAEIADLRGSMVVSRGQAHRLDRLPGYIALIDNRIVGLITYALSANECEIVSLDSKAEGQGFGTELIRRVIGKADECGCTRVWLITSNDNIKAIRFYQRRGFDLIAVHPNAIAEARKIKPSIPLTGYDGIPVRHELEFEYRLEPYEENEPRRRADT